MPPVVLNPPSVDARDEAVDALFGDCGQVVSVFFHVPGDRLRRLVVIEARHDFFTKSVIMHYLHALVFRILSSDICFVMSFGGVVSSSGTIAAKFIPDRRDGTAERFRNFCKAVPFLFQYEDFTALALGKVRVFCS